MILSYYFMIFLIRYITYYLLWQIARLLVLPNVSIFPMIPPSSIWISIYIGFLWVTTAFFWFAVYYTSYLFVIYVILDTVVRWLFWIYIGIMVPAGQIIAEILLNISPLKDLRESGLVALFYELVGIVFSKKSFSRRILDFIKALFNFLAVASGLKRRVTNIQEQIVKSPNINDENSNNNSVKDSYTTSNNTKKEDTKPADLGGIKLTNQYAKANFEKCYAENYKQLTDNMSTIEKIKTRVENSRVSSLCGLNALKTLDISNKNKE